MKYRKIMPKIWYELRTLNSNCKAVAFYCLTSPQVNRIGFYHFSEALACEDLNISLNCFRKAFETVCQTFEWKFDKQSKMFLIPSWFSYNAPENNNVLKSFVKEFEDIPKNNLTDEFIRISEGYGIQFPIPLSIPFRKGMPNSPEYQAEPNQNRTEPEPNPCSIDQIINLFNNTCFDLPKVKEETPHRKQIVRARSKKLKTLNEWNEFFQRVHKSNFLNQRIDGKDFKANFNWILKEDNFVKILEGNFDNRDISKISLPAPDRKLPPEAEAKAKRTEHKLTPEEKAMLDANLKKLGIKKIGKVME